MAINKEIMEDIIENILMEDTRDRLLIHYDGFIGRGKEYSMIIPYSSISSMEIRHSD